MPPRILKQRSIAFGCWFIFCLGSSFFIRTYFSNVLTSIVQVTHVALHRNTSTLTPHRVRQTGGFCPLGRELTRKPAVVYYIPIWFQAIKGVSAVESGIRNIPMILGLVVFSIITGIIITAQGYYTPWMILSSVLMATGAGLLSTFNTGAGHAMWIGYQVIYGCGVGAGIQFRQPFPILI